MKNHMRFISLMLMVIMTVSLVTGCSNTKSATESNEPTVNATTASAGTAEETKEAAKYGPILTKALETGTLTCALNAVEPPWQFHKVVNGKDEIFGFDKAICAYVGDELTKKLGREVVVKFEDMSWDGVLSGIAAGKYDLAPGAAATEERKKNMDFSIPYHKSRQVIVINKDNKDDPMFSTDKQLEGVQVGVLKGSSTAITLSNHYSKCKLFELGSQNDVLLSVINKKCPAANFNEKYAILMCKANPELMIVNELTFELTDKEDAGSCICFPKGNEDFKAILDEMVARIKSDGTFTKMEEDALNALDDADLLAQFKLLNKVSN